MLIGYLLHPVSSFQFTQVSQVLAESERNRADLAVAYGQHLNLKHQNQQLKLGEKNNFLETGYFKLPPVAEKMFRTLEVICDCCNITYTCVCIMMALIQWGAGSSLLLQATALTGEGIFGEGKALSQPTRECPQRSAGRLGLWSCQRLPGDPLS